MSDLQTDPRSPSEDDAGRDAAEGSDAIVPHPVHDEVTVELVRDAIGVARGELSDERFSEKYDTADEPPDEGNPSTTAADGDRPDR